MGHWDRVEVKEYEHGVHCDACEAGWYRMNEAAKAALGSSCRVPKCTGTMVEYQEERVRIEKVAVCSCGKQAFERYSMGLYAGLYCDRCWDESGYVKAGPGAFDPSYAGERYEDDY